MASNATPEFTIPTIDVSPYLRDPNSPGADHIVKQIRNACITSGFFQMIGHGIPKDLQLSVLKCASKVFSLPSEEKLKLRTTVGRGYEAIGAQTLESGMKPDLKEGYFVGPEISDNKLAHGYSNCPNKWPTESLLPSHDFKIPLLDYHQRLCKLAFLVMEIITKGMPYGGKDLLSTFCKNVLSVMRLLHYPPQENLDDPTQLGAGAHTDFGSITLLLQDENGGLQVFNKKTGDWIDVIPNAEAYVVNLGDMLPKMTKGEYKSNMHRVINRSGADRYSVPFFYEGNPEYVLRPLDRSEEGGVTVEQFLKQRFIDTYGTY